MKETSVKLCNFLCPYTSSLTWSQSLLDLYLDWSACNVTFPTCNLLSNWPQAWTCIVMQNEWPIPEQVGQLCIFLQFLNEVMVICCCHIYSMWNSYMPQWCLVIINKVRHLLDIDSAYHFFSLGGQQSSPLISNHTWNFLIHVSTNYLRQECLRFNIRYFFQWCCKS